MSTVLTRARKSNKTSKPVGKTKPKAIPPLGDINLHFSPGMKDLLLHLLERATDLIHEGKLSDTADLGILCRHIQDLAAHVEESIAGCVPDGRFDQGFKGQLVNYPLCRELQDTPDHWNLPWNEIVTGEISIVGNEDEE